MVRLLIIFYFLRVTRISATIAIAGWFVLQLFSGFSQLASAGMGESGGVAFWAHVGGFLGGAALVWLFKDDELLLNHPYHGWNQSSDPVDIWNDPQNRQ